MGYVPIVLILLVMVLAELFCIACERIEWNKGVCKESGLPWKLMPTDEATKFRDYSDGKGSYCRITHKVDIL